MVHLVHLFKALLVVALFGFVTVTILYAYVNSNNRIPNQIYIRRIYNIIEQENKTKIQNVLSKNVTNPKPQNEIIDIVYTWVNGSDPNFLNNLKIYSVTEKKQRELAGRRFRDKNELRFSLRSIEKYASWVNHVYIVTNGQVPYWLNTSYEKVSIITHEQIFRDVKNLPTFSSPAIESNLHRIPGISKRFIYFNDDVFLGQPLSQEDFYTEETGYKVFFAWPVPNCKPQCPWSKVQDGKCHAACNNMECQYDGGDCSKNHTVPAYDRTKIKTASLDGYGASLLHSQRLLNIRYGFKDRKVAAHAPIMIDRDIMNKLEKVYEEEFKHTESNRFRAVDDIQFGFVYYSFLTNEKDNNHTMDDVFNEFDTDKSGTWTQAELTEFLIKINKSPPDTKTKEEFDSKVNQCNSTDNDSAYQDKSALSRDWINNCALLRNYIVDKMNSLPKYKFEVTKKSESLYSTMERLMSNVSKVRAQLKKLSSKMTKFVCINDDLDDAKPKENKAVEELLQNFYLSQFPQVSAFEVSEPHPPTMSPMVEDTQQKNVIVLSA
ncbi:uncharacterized protein LOC143193513 isoform X2 [Rhynchophorus ferrugineus]|uniref:uncharacterized protein LOC143193513 isoform X2 n=1 Tax=Rhynchophorus ferrugineus TaxID=354439 RepID=UPI003FCD9098